MEHPSSPHGRSTSTSAHMNNDNPRQSRLQSPKSQQNANARISMMSTNKPHGSIIIPLKDEDSTPLGYKDNYELDLNEDYLFYSNPGSREPSIYQLSSPDLVLPKEESIINISASKSSLPAHALGAPKDQNFLKQSYQLPALSNPLVRKQLQQLRTHQPWFLGLLSLAQVGLMITELIINMRTTGSLIQTEPFNYMIGPHSGTLIKLGARFVPCMKGDTGFDVPGIIFDCPAGIIGSFTNGTKCTLSEVCGFSGFPSGKPDQWYRFILPIFLHGGVLHLLFNLAFQIQAGFALERDIGWWRMALIYFICGVSGFVFGSFLSDVRVPSVGASGALYGIVACLLLDLIQNWSLVKNPWFELIKMIFNVLISFLIGTLPYVDNLAHFGGFVSGIFAGLLLMPKIYFGVWDRRRKIFFMICSVPALILFLYFTGKWFYEGGTTCTWCQYINCIPGMPWCDQKFSTVTKIVNGTLSG